MDEGFNVRVDKVFGSLTPSRSSSLRSLWSLTDQEVEKKEWNRERENPDRDENPCSSSFDRFFSDQRKLSRIRRKNLEDVDEEDDDLDDDEDKLRGTGSSTQSFDEEWDVKSSIGLDCTLDNEEEEDENDKVALGKEDSGDRLYMNDITDYGPYLNSHNVIPASFKDHERDSRANLMAARIRLKEDEEAEEASGTFDGAYKTAAVTDSLLTEDNPKSILKRKENQADSKSPKRVRFDSACKVKSIEEEEELEAVMKTNTEIVSPQVTRGVPDYVKNPSKYTMYSFESSDEDDEKTNKQALMDFLNMVKTSSGVEEVPSSSPGLPESVKFVPKKKGGSSTTAVKVSQGLAPGIAAVEVSENEACAMEEDVPLTRSVSSHKPGRQYRSRVQPDDSV